MIRRPPRSTRTGHTLSRHDVLPILASGANFGLRRTVPHALGVCIGFTLMIILVGVGLMELFDLFPILNLILKVVSVAYLLWLAWKIATAAAPETGGGARGKPMSLDRKRVVSGKSGSVRVDIGGRRDIKKKIDNSNIAYHLMKNY